MYLVGNTDDLSASS